jgi:hypothetical protein
MCRRAYGASEWQELPVVTTVPAASVQGYLSVPAAWDVELRRCTCGASLAAVSCSCQPSAISFQPLEADR